MLARAKTILDGERCSQCGLPKYICQSDNPDLEYRMEKEVCNATKAKEKYEDTEEKKRAKRKGKEAEKPPAGEAVYPVPYMLSGADLGSLREPFWEEFNKKQEQIAATRPAD